MNKIIKDLQYLLRPRCRLHVAIDKVAKKHNLSEQQVQQLKAQFANPEQELQTDGELQTSRKTIPMDIARDGSIDILLQAHGYNPKDWELIKSTNKQWNGYSKLHGIVDLVSSAITVKPKFLLKEKDIIETFNNLKAPKLENYTYQPAKRQMLELMLPDLHFGKLAWDKETDMDYDIKIACKIFREMILKLISEITFPLEEIVYILGNDFFNVDNSVQETKKGTRQDCDGRWQKIYMVGCQEIIWAIEHLRKIAPVKVFYVPGNHDYTWSYFATLNTSAWYRNCSNVEVSVSPKGRKYYQYGNNLIGWTHGEEKAKNIDKVMQAEARKMWGLTQYHELHAGHKHVEEVASFPGLIFRRIPSYVADDAWHIQEGYVGKTRRTQAFLWDFANGLKNVINLNLEVKEWL